MKNNLTGKIAVIVCHDSVPGPPHELRDYLLRHQVSRLLFIGHVNRFVVKNRIQSSYLTIFEYGVETRTLHASELHLSEYLMYIHDALLTVYWILFYSKGRIDYFIGLGNLNAFVGLFLKFFGRVSCVIYYVIDYMPQRFSNQFMNSLYHVLDKYCAEQSTATWNYGKGMISAREQKWKKSFPQQLHTPHGVTIREKLGKSMLNYNETQLMYMGSLLEQQGLQLVLEALPTIKKAIPSVKLTVIGTGPYKSALELLVKKNALLSCVHFQGFMEDPFEVDTMLSQATLGLATYKNDIGFVMYTEPSKVRRYLSCSLPVLITQGTPLSDDVKKNNCGEICLYDPQDAAKKVISILRNNKRQQVMRKQAILYAKEFTWETIYTRAFSLTVC